MYFDERENMISYASNNANYYSNEDNNNNIVDMNFDNMVINNYRNVNIANLQTGFNRGNMFNDLYVPYKNYSFKIKVNNSQDEALLRIQELSFAINDLNLYLDLHPTDNEALAKFNEYVSKYTSLKQQYNNNYLPLCAENIYKSTFNYIKGPWPWNEGGTNV